MADGATARVHLVKLCVGARSVDDLAAWQRSRRAQADPARGDRRPVHVTRMWPRRASEVLAGGSLYWVIQGAICVRQRILALDPVVDAAGTRRCAIVLDPDLVRTAARPRKPFQGWRYLEAADAPPDAASARSGRGDLPPDLEAELAELGVLQK